MAKSKLSAQWDREIIQGEMLLAVMRAYSRAISGDVAEFGTMTANSAQALALGISEAERIHYERKGRQSPDQKRLHLFDSFEGLPDATAEPDRKHPSYVEGDWRAGQHKVFGPEKLRAKCSQFVDESRIKIYEGWFKDTVPKLDAAIKFALVHVDCDFYGSTMDVLVPLFSKAHVSSGALIYFDDYHCAASSPELGERRAWDEIQDRFKVKAIQSHCYGPTGQAFVVDSYDTRDHG